MLNVNSINDDNQIKPIFYNLNKTKNIWKPNINQTLQKTNNNSWFNIQKFYSHKNSQINVLNYSDPLLDKFQDINKKLNKYNKPIDENKIYNKVLDANKKFKNKNDHLVEEYNKILLMKKNQGKYNSCKKIHKRLVRVKKIRIYLNKEQKFILKNWFGTCRYIYNNLLTKIKNKEEIPNFRNLRNKYIPKNKISQEWMLNTPKDVRAEAIKDLCNNYKNNFDKIKKGLIDSFDLKYKSKKNLSQSIVIPLLASKSNKINEKYINLYTNFLDKNCQFKISKREKLPKIEFDCRLQFVKPNIYYLCIPYTSDYRYKTGASDNQGEQIISLDPGVRTFVTGYSPNGYLIKIGNNDVYKIFRLCLSMDKLKSKIDDKNINCKKRLKLIKKKHKLRMKIINLKDELHFKVCNYLCKNFNTILIPKFDVSKMVIKKTRKIKSKSVKQLLNLNHYQFRQRLIEKSYEYNNCKIIICNEAYTSATCGDCRFINYKIGGVKVYKCKVCKYEIDRDINGARNILLRALSVDSSLVYN